MLNEAFWTGRRVLVTGHAGFKGSWLCAWLARLGAEVTGIGHLPGRQPSLFEAAGLAERVRSHEGDVRDGERLRRLVRNAAPEVIFHLAGQPLVLVGVSDPVTTFATNVMGAVNLLDAARAVDSVMALVIVTSDKCYREGGLICDEDTPLGGSEPYGASKACAEHVAAAYRATYFLPTRIGVATARAGNVVGGGDMAPDRLIPDLVRAHAAGRAAVLRKPDAVRPWQHVLDALAGYLSLAELLALEPDRFSEAWNFGPDWRATVTVGELAAAFLRELGGGPVVQAPEPSRHEAPVLRLSAARAQKWLGWRPRLAATEAIRWTAEAYDRLLRHGDAGWLDQQIACYTARLPAAIRPAATVHRELSLVSA